MDQQQCIAIETKLCGAKSEVRDVKKPYVPNLRNATIDAENQLGRHVYAQRFRLRGVVFEVRVTYVPGWLKPHHRPHNFLEAPGGPVGKSSN